MAQTSIRTHGQTGVATVDGRATCGSSRGCFRGGIYWTCGAPWPRASNRKPRCSLCSDSRVPAEIIFDQSLGDLFVVRTAGLVLDPTSIGSLEYAVAHLHVPLLVIKGHEGCGAVTAAVEHPDGPRPYRLDCRTDLPAGSPGPPGRKQRPRPGRSHHGHPPQIAGR